MLNPDILKWARKTAAARSDAIGPRSRLGLLGLRKSFPACDASLRITCEGTGKNCGGMCTILRAGGCALPRLRSGQADPTRQEWLKTQGPSTWQLILPGGNSIAALGMTGLVVLIERGHEWPLFHGSARESKSSDKNVRPTRPVQRISFKLKVPRLRNRFPWREFNCRARDDRSGGVDRTRP